MSSKNLKLAVYLVFLMVYVFPNGLVFGPFNAIHNHIFAAILGLLYIIPIIKKGKIKKRTFFIWLGVMTIAVYTRKFGFIDMIIIPIIDEFIKNKEEVKKIVLKSPIVLLSIFFTFIYSVLYSKLGVGGRGEGSIGSGLLFTAIGEINLTGLSIFYLSIITRKKYRRIGTALMMIGFLTVSRSYMIAIFCFIFFNIKIIKKFINKFLGLFTYLNLTVVSSIILYIFGCISVYMFLNGGIATHNINAGFKRLFVFNDYSNYFRFLAIYLVVEILLNHPFEALLGITDKEYLTFGSSICKRKKLIFNGTGPHNIFFSHLKIYGIAVFFEIYYISKYLKKIVTANNFRIFLPVFLYCIILGTGYNSYWLFLALIALVLYE